jgi:hypothetical protein
MGERERQGAASPVITENWGPRWAKQIPGERPRETAVTWHTGSQPSRHVRRKGAAPFSGAGELIARASSALYSCLLSLRFGIIN